MIPKNNVVYNVNNMIRIKIIVIFLLRFRQIIFFFSICGISVVHQRTNIIYRIRMAQILSFHILFFSFSYFSYRESGLTGQEIETLYIETHIYEWPAVYVRRLMIISIYFQGYPIRFKNWSFLIIYHP
jgi:hypothetical protein